MLLIVANFSESDKECEITVPEEAFAFFGATYNENPQKAVELLSGQNVELTFNPFDKTCITVPANSGVILKFKI